MDEMRALCVGLPDTDKDKESGGGGRVEGHADGEKESRVGVGRPSLTSDCYAPLVEAYAQASMWNRTIEAYCDGFASGLERVEPVDYRVRFAGACGATGAVCFRCNVCGAEWLRRG